MQAVYCGFENNQCLQNVTETHATPKPEQQV